MGASTTRRIPSCSRYRTGFDSVVPLAVPGAIGVAFAAYVLATFD